MTASDDKIPKSHQAFYFEPRFSTWKQEALANREKLLKQGFWGLTPQGVRSALKLPIDRPLVMSGHQPVFFHPGLWAKCLAASTLADSLQGVAVHKVTDTDLVPENPSYIPEVEENGKARRKALEFFTAKDTQKLEKITPCAFLPPPDFAALQKIFANAKVFSPKSVQQAMKGYEEKLTKGLKANPTWNGFHLHTLKLLDEMSGTKRTYLTASKLWNSEPFLTFLTAWLTNLPSLNENYNQALNEYRQKHNIQHELTPMPNLKFEDWWFEIPFWGVNKYQQRHSLWAKNDGKHLVLKIKGGEGTFSISWDEFKQELSTLPITIWPKALPQTLFCRLYLCDYFVHGVGGGNYEEVNDLFFEKVFKSKPPAFGTATATYWVEWDQVSKIEDIVHFGSKIEWWQRALEKNPEYLFTKQEVWKKELPPFIQKSLKPILERPELQALALEKGKWVESLANPAQKVQAVKKIEEINKALYDQYHDAIFALEQGLMDVDRLRQADQVLTFREYPFFCFPPATFAEMKEKTGHYLRST